MCQISHNITFCSCTGFSIGELKHYWVLYRHNKGKKFHIIGEPIWPIYDDCFDVNEDTLLARLAEEDAFDVPMEFQLKDRFVVVLNSDSDHFQAYAFKYTSKGLQKDSYDYFDFKNLYDEWRFGKLKNVFARKV